MLNFQEELKKYQPLTELNHIEEELHASQIQDLLDLLQYIATKDTKQKRTDHSE